MAPVTHANRVTAVRQAADAMREYERAARQAQLARDRAIKAAIKAGVPARVVAAAARMTPARVSQLAPKPRPAEPALEVTPPERESARKTPAPPTLAADVPLVSTYTSTRALTHYGTKVTAYVDDKSIVVGARTWHRDARVYGTMEGILTQLYSGELRDVTRVYLVGPRTTLGDNAAEVRQWIIAGAQADGWQAGMAGHYLADADLPVGRYEQVGVARAVEVHRAATWFGEGDYTAQDAAAAHAWLQSLLGKHFDGAVWLSTPSTTGRDLWRRTIPVGREWPVMSPELRELIAATSGQGRMELLPCPPDVPRLPELGSSEVADGFVYLDGRFMYAGLTWGMPVGEPTWHQFMVGGQRSSTGGLDVTDPVKVLSQRGRWRAVVRVPADWAHVGIVPCMTGGGWEYPREPGRSFETWADGCELLLAVRNGWQVNIQEGVTWSEGKPLDTWTRKLVAMRDQLDDTTGERDQSLDVARTLVRAGIRSILLHAVGAFAARTHLVTRQADAYTGNAALTVGGVHEAPGGGVIWSEHAAPSAWSEAMAHPEWPAQIWARARVRLLDGPGIAPREPIYGTNADGTAYALRTGALHVPYGNVIGFRTDALFLTDDPLWADDGKPGRFRVKGKILEPVAWPRNLTELFALRDRAEATS